MKTLDRFIEQVMESARLVRAHDLGSATDVIQKALQDAGLVPHGGKPAAGAPAAGGPAAGAPAAGAPAAPFADTDTDTDTDADAERAPEFVDLNPPPGWSANQAKRAGQGAPKPGVKARARRTPGAGFVPPSMPGGFSPSAFANSDFMKGFNMPGMGTPGVVTPDPAAPGEFVDGSFTCDAGTRRYKLYIPSTPSTSPRPLIVMLHGCTQHAADFAAGTRMNAVAERHGCLVLYPEQERSANPNNCWNWFDPAHQGTEDGEPAILAGMTREVARQQGADTGRIFVAGLSAGGAMAAILGASHPELYAAVGVHSGLAAGSAKDMLSGLKAMKQPRKGRSLRRAVPVIVFHGDGDAVVHPGNGASVVRQYVDAHGKNKAPLREHSEQRSEGGRNATRTSWRNAEDASVAEHWVLHGAAHAWSGGSASGSHTDTTGPSASEEMLRFFLATSGPA